MAIHQKLSARLVQKLILTPSLQQAIKLLPMSTLELAELLNQEMVENPMLEEVPAEDAQQTDTPQTQEQAEAAKTTDERNDTWDDADYEYFFGEYLDDGYRPRQPQEVKELPPIENTLSTKSSLADHSDVAAQPADQRLDGAGDRRRHHRQHRRGRLPGRVGQRDRGAGRAGTSVWSSRRWSTCSRSIRLASARATCRSACCCSCGTWAWPARRPRCWSAITCGCCRTTAFPSWGAR